MKKQIKRQIYLLSKRHLKPIEVVQYETGVQFIFEVQDIELDTSATATLFVRKPSGKFVFQEDNISLTGNTVVIDLHNQAITEYGKPFFQIKFKKDEEVISTYSGMLTVEKSLDDSGAEESKTVLAAFEELTDEQIARIEETTRSQIDLMKTEVEAKGETVLATIPDEYTEMYNRVNTLFDSVANAIKGTVSGSVVRVDDVSPIEHSVQNFVRGKNLFDISKIENTDTATNNGDGSITIAANTYYCRLNQKLREVCPQLKAGDTAILSLNSTSENTKYMYFHGLQGTWQSGCYLTLTDAILESYVTIYGFPDTENGQECVVSDIQIEIGKVVTEYTPYIDPTAVTVRRCGKNLVDLTGFEFNDSDYTHIRYSGDNSSDALYDFLKNHTGESIVLSMTATGEKTGIDIGSIRYYAADNTLICALVPGVAHTIIELPEEYTCSYIYGGTNGASVENIQVEFGTVSTDFEKYNGTEHTPSSDGTVEGITSLSPVMTLLTDTEGVTIKCEYNKDAGKVIEKLSNAVVALGGVV